MSLVWTAGVSIAATPEVRYPVRPIKLVVPFAAGGGSDTFARIIQNAIEKNRLLPQPLVIINVPGAGGTIGSRRVKNARPDGYTLLLLHEGMMTARHSGQASFGEESFEPILGTGNATQVVAVGPSSEYDSLQSLMEAATEAPESIVFAANVGAPSHFAGLMLQSQRDGARFRYTQIGGGAKRFAAIQGGHVDVSAFSIAEFVQFRSSGMKALAILGQQRHQDLPLIPTASEQGFEVVSENMQFWWAPRGTSPDRIDVIADAVSEAMQTAEVRTRLEEMRIENVTIRGEDLRNEIDRRSQRIAEVAPDAAIELPNFSAMVLFAVFATGGLALIRGSTHRRPSPARREALDAGTNHQRFYRIEFLTVASATILYVTVLQTSIIGFVPATLLFTIACGVILSIRDRGIAEKPVKVSVAILLTAATMSIVLSFLFTRVLVVDLP